MSPAATSASRPHPAPSDAAGHRRLATAPSAATVPSAAAARPTPPPGSAPRAARERPARPPVAGWRAAAVGLSLAVLVAGCGSTTAPPAAVSSPPVVVTASSSFNGTDLAWIQLMIPMNQQQLPVLELAGQRNGAPAVRELTERIRDSHQQELAQLRALFGRTGLPDDNPHAGHDMPGLVNEAKLASLTAASGAEFETRWRELLREHLDQRASLAKSEQQSGVDPEAKALAQRIEQAATAHRQALDQLG